MNGRVIVVGSVNLDFVVRGTRLPRPGETVTGGTFERHEGGKGANQAVAAARLGAETLFVGAVGDDELGTAARDDLAAEGVDVTHLTVLAATTGVALILVAADGENAISVAPGANMALPAAAVRDALAAIAVGPGDVVLVSNEIPVAAVLAALEAGRAAGARTILNPAPADGLDARALRLTDVLTPNRSELAALSGTSDARRGAGRLLLPARSGPVAEGIAEAIIVTLGVAGALLVRQAASAATFDEFPAPLVEAVDTTGAGDAFSGCLAASLAGGRSIDDAVRRAVVAGSLATTRPGARAGMPTAAELEAALR